MGAVSPVLPLKSSVKYSLHLPEKISDTLSVHEGEALLMHEKVKLTRRPNPQLPSNVSVSTIAQKSEWKSPTAGIPSHDGDAPS